jgi:uncharacterized protein YciI
MKFVNYLAYTDNQQLLAEHAPAHKLYVKSLLDAGKLAFGGPFPDGSGGLLVYEVASREEAESLRDQDPFALSGVFVRSEIKPWLLLAINPALAVTPAA